MPYSGLNITVAPRRMRSLDILRAVAILLMIFSGLLPKTLPNWMDHGYNAHFLPDASGQWNLRPGLADGTLDNLFLREWNGRPWSSFTWVDLVFPMFLFAMGAAIPIALSRILEFSGYTRGNVVVLVFKRWLILLLFAALVVHLTPHFFTSSNPNTSRLVVIASFLLAMLFFVRWPAGTPAAAERTIRTTALAGMVVLIAAYAVRNSTAFSWAQSDTIILVLGQTYLVASLAWLVSRRHPVARFVVLIPLIFLAHYLQFAATGLEARRWLGDWPIATASPISSGIKWILNLPNWLIPRSESVAGQKFFEPIVNLAPLWDFSWYKYLFIVIPGTVVGDWLRAWNDRRTITASPFDRDLSDPPVHRQILLAVIVLCAAVFVGLRHSGYPFMSVGGALQTPWLALVLTVPALGLVAWRVLPTAYGVLWILRRLFYFGSGFLLLGIIFACWPVEHTGYFEGGISKGPPSTLSYYLVSVGLCSLVLMALIARNDYNRTYGPMSSLLEANGQNSLLAYFIAHSVLGAVMGLTFLGIFNHPFGANIESLDDLALRYYQDNHHWIATGWAALKTLLIAAAVWMFSSNRIFWRA